MVTPEASRMGVYGTAGAGGKTPWPEGTGSGLTLPDRRRRLHQAGQRLLFPGRERADAAAAPSCARQVCEGRRGCEGGRARRPLEVAVGAKSRGRHVVAGVLYLDGGDAVRG